MSFTEKIFTVTEINSISRKILEESFDTVNIEGEISNLKLHSSGHMYFTIKDAGASIDSIMYNSYVERLDFQPVNGQKVIVRGRVSIFIKAGRYQILAYTLKERGMGKLEEQFLKLKKKLETEGLFENKHKKAIPQVPNVIGVITSPTGAAIKDIINVIQRRFSNVKLIIAPARVQGQKASQEITKALNIFNTKYKTSMDVIILTRGGGSLEDLWPFNEEITARAVFDSEIPVISAVGHEIDFTICDFVADLRAPTPSAAAEIVIKNKTELAKRLSNISLVLFNYMENIIKQNMLSLNNFSDAAVYKYPYKLLDQKTMEFDYISTELDSKMTSIFKDLSNKFEIIKSKLYALNPNEILKRGYSITYLKSTGTMIKNVLKLHNNDIIVSKLMNGTIESSVIKKKANNGSKKENTKRKN